MRVNQMMNTSSFFESCRTLIAPSTAQKESHNCQSRRTSLVSDDVRLTDADKAGLEHLTALQRFRGLVTVVLSFSIPNAHDQRH